MKFNALAKATVFASLLSPSLVLGYCATNTSHVLPDQGIRARTAAANETHLIDVFFHVASTRANQGLITDDIVNTQVSTRAVSRFSLRLAHSVSTV